MEGKTAAAASSDSQGFDSVFLFLPGRNLSGTLPLLEDKVRQVEALGGMAAPADANMTESISKIKDIIEETRNLVSRVSFIYRSN